MKHIRHFEQFIINAADETFDFETYLSYEIAIYQKYIENIMCCKQIMILDAAGKSNFLSHGLSFHGYNVYSVNPIDVILPQSFQSSMKQRIKHFQWHNQEQFDVVILAHNTISEYLTEHDLHQVIQQIHRVLDKNGVLLITTYFYDQLLRLQPKNNAPMQFAIGNKRCIQLELWDWMSGHECTYQQDHFFIQQIADRYTIHNSRSQHRAWRRAEINMILSRVGFLDIQYHSGANNHMLVSAHKI